MKIKYGLFLLIIIEALIFSIFFTLKSGYFFYDEADIYLSHFLSNKTFLQKIFDFRVTEIGSFRAREVSTFFNYLDAKFILLSAHIGIPNFLSLSHYAGLFCICILQLLMTRKYLSKKMPWISLFLLVLFLTAPGPFFTGSYYRSSKILTAVFLAIQIWFLFIISKRSLIRKQQALSEQLLLTICMAILAVVSILSDEGGFAFTLVLAFYSFAHFFFYRESRMRATAIGYGIGIIVALIYRLYLGRVIILVLFGIDTPIYNSTESILDVSILPIVLRLLLSYFSFFFGNLPRLLIGAFWLSCFFVLFFLKTKNTERRLKIKTPFQNINRFIEFCFLDGFLVFYGFVSTLAILNIMVLNHGLIYYPEVSLLYYLIPFQTLYLLGVSFAFHKLMTKWPKMYIASIGFLVLLIGYNLRGIETHYQLMKTLPHSLETPYFSVSNKMISAVKNPTIPLKTFGLDANATASVTLIRETFKKEK